MRQLLRDDEGLFSWTLLAIYMFLFQFCVTDSHVGASWVWHGMFDVWKGFSCACAPTGARGCEMRSRLVCRGCPEWLAG